MAPAVRGKEEGGHNTLTFRIDQGIVDELRLESKQKIASLNTLVNQILSFYVRRYKPSQVAGDIPFSKDLLHLMIDVLTPEQMDIIVEEYIKYELKEQLVMLGWI